MSHACILFSSEMLIDKSDWSDESHNDLVAGLILRANDEDAFFVASDLDF